MSTNTYEDIKTFLRTEVPGHDITVAAYLDRLSAAAWDGDISIAKFGWTGDSGWRSDLYDALRSCKIMPLITDEDYDHGDTFIELTITSRSTLEQL